MISARTRVSSFGVAPGSVELTHRPDTDGGVIAEGGFDESSAIQDVSPR